MRIGIFFVAAVATLMGIYIKSVYALWFLCSDLVYVVLFPQLVSVVYLKSTNTYGSMVAYWIGIVMRLLAGEPLFGIPPIIQYPLFDKSTEIQKFPFRTFSMLISFFLTITVSYLTKFLFENNHLSKKFDIFNCFSGIPIESVALSDSVTVDEFSKLHVNSKQVINEIDDDAKTKLTSNLNSENKISTYTNVDMEEDLKSK